MKKLLIHVAVALVAGAGLGLLLAVGGVLAATVHGGDAGTSAALWGGFGVVVGAGGYVASVWERP